MEFASNTAGITRKNMSNAKNGNIGKHDAYALAFDMINEAIASCCPLQAIAIEESILTDRLWSTLNVGVEVTDKDVERMSLGGALKAWHPDEKASESKKNPNRLKFDEEMERIYSELDRWRRMRNSLLHSIAKSRQGDAPAVPAEEFREYAQYAAKNGLRLVRTVANWTQKTIRKSKKS